MITVSITVWSSNANWSWLKTPIFFGRVTEPFEASISPVMIFISVDLPAPFGPVIAYRRLEIKVVLTSSNRMRAPNRIETLFIESCMLQITPGRNDELPIVTRDSTEMVDYRGCSTNIGSQCSIGLCSFLSILRFCRCWPSEWAHCWARPAQTAVKIDIIPTR